MIGEKFGSEFQEGGGWGQIDDEALHRFWQGYKWLIKDGFGKPVGNYTGKRREWMADYLRVFEDENETPHVAVRALAHAMVEWSSFSSMLAAYEGKPAFPEKEYPDPYSLGVYAHVFLDFWLNGYHGS